MTAEDLKRLRAQADTSGSPFVWVETRNRGLECLALDYPMLISSAGFGVAVLEQGSA